MSPIEILCGTGEGTGTVYTAILRSELQLPNIILQITIVTSLAKVHAFVAGDASG